ncbi:MSC_0882 family membrane protein [Mycoplasma sp. 3118]|uniref:MSC_0882 family membrane protein n=1 Tax=unclassified Mycoplasma TaxID=2683645 RepID=UPI003AAE5C7B
MNYSQNNSDLQQITTQVPQTLETTVEAQVASDPQRIIATPVYNVIRREKRLTIMQFLFWFALFLVSIAGILTNYFLNTRVDKNQGIAWYVLVGIVFLVSLSLFAKALTKNKAWRRTEQMCRDNYRNGNLAAVTVISDTYRAIRFKLLRLSWLFAFFMTYFALFNGVILLLLNLWDGHWVLNIDKANLKLNLDLDWEKILNGAFGDVYVLLYIDLAVAVGFTFLFVLMVMYDRKRYMEASTFLGTDATAIKNAVNAELKNENKAWIKAYIIVFIIVVLLPLALLCYLIWKGILRRGKK